MASEFALRCPITADLGLIRDLIRMHGHYCGLPERRLDDLVLAANEAVTNVLDHGGASGVLTVRGHADGVMVQVLDVAGLLTRGHLAAAALDQTASHGYGLWVIQYLCDAVTVEQTGGGSLLSMWVRRTAERPAGDGSRTQRAGG